MSDAIAVQGMILRVSKPWTPWDNTKSKLARAAERLEAYGLEFAYSRVERAYKLRAGRRIREAITEAFERWEAGLALQRPTVDRELALELCRLKEAIDASSDPEFYQPHFEALCDAMYAAGKPDDRVGEQD